MDHIYGAYDQLVELDDAYPTNDGGYGFFVGKQAPPPMISKFVRRGFAGAVSPILAGVNYLTGTPPYKNTAKREGYVSLPSWTVGDIKMSKNKTAKRKPKVKPNFWTSNNLRKFKPGSGAYMDLGYKRGTRRAFVQSGRPAPKKYVPPALRNMGSLVSARRKPPVSYIPTVNSGMKTTFSRGRNPECMRTRMRFRVAQLISTVPATGAYNGIDFKYATGNRGKELPLCLTNNFYFPFFITNFARLFDFTYFNSCYLEYEPRVNTTNVAAILMAYEKDPEWPESKGALSAASVNPTEAQLISLATCCTDVAYNKCRVVADLSRNKFFNSGENLSTKIDYGVQQPASLRQVVNGLFMVTGVSNTGDLDGVIYGDVYMTIDFELCGFSLASTTAVTISRAVREEKLFHDKVRRIIDSRMTVDDDFVVPASIVPRRSLVDPSYDDDEVSFSSRSSYRERKVPSNK